MQRRLVHWVKDLVGCPDAYHDLARLYRKARAAAILDIGSHEGSTVQKILDFLPEAKVHAFEPTPETALVLRQRMASRSNVTVHELAMADRTGTLTFFRNTGSQTNSLLDNAKTADPAFVRWQAHVAEIQVKSMSLDDWAQQYEPTGELIVKADIQGAEKLLVAGGKRVFAERVAAFYTEVCLLPLYDGQTTFWELHRMLTDDLGFALFDIYPCGKDALGRAAWTDAMWVKPRVLPVES